ncbi:MAG: lipid-A-disaccharide synthase [Nitrospirota bacterium]
MDEYGIQTAFSGKKVLIIAGEASGDMHGGTLARELLKQDSSLRLYGVGSKHMKEAGVHMLADAAELSVVGALEVLTHIRAIYRVFNTLKRFLKQERPDLLVLIDFPEFNILLGKAAKKIGVPILYYISPQVWAWRRGRIKTIASLVKTIVVVLPFEVDLYKPSGVDVRFVGHPLTDTVQSSYTQQEARKQFGLDIQKRTVAILPGSRTKEITHILPVLLETAGLLKTRFPELQFIMPVAHTLSKDFIGTFMDAAPVQVKLVEGQVYDVLRASDAAMVTSGTATLETGLMAVPMVIVYRFSTLSYIIGRMLVYVKQIGLINIVAGEQVAPELVQHKATPKNIADAMTAILEDPEQHQRMRNQLIGIRKRLGDGGTSARVASVVLDVLKGNNHA